MALSKKVKSDFNLITKDLLDIPTKLKDNTYKDRSLKVLRSSVGKYNRYFFNNFLNRSDGLIYSKNRSVFMDNLITAIYKAALNKAGNDTTKIKAAKDNFIKSIEDISGKYGGIQYTVDGKIIGDRPSDISPYAAEGREAGLLKHKDY